MRTHPVSLDSYRSLFAPGTRGRANLAILLFLNLFLVIFLGAAAGEDKKEKAYQTQYSDIFYLHEDDLYDFGKKIGGANSFLNRDNEKALGLVRENVDRIVYRVKTLLDMYPPNFHFNIRLYASYKELKDAYRETGKTGAAPIAFYSHKSATIYLSTEKLTDGVFAHEVAHAVVNYYFDSPPPAQMQEILAQYVDKHLWDQ